MQINRYIVIIHFVFDSEKYWLKFVSLTNILINSALFLLNGYDGIIKEYIIKFIITVL
jgi:hypothetical protein